MFHLNSIKALLLPFVLMVSCQATEKPTEPDPPVGQKITIASAANMQFAIKEIAQRFSTIHGIPYDLVISSSGKLTAQIKEGAPFDVFVAANKKYPEELFKAGLTHTSPQIYARGKLVLWSMIEDLLPSLEQLNHPSVQHIALANPKTAPYGAAALAALNHYQLYEPIKNKLVYGESIAQTNQFIVTQSADLGFTAKSVVLSPNIKGQGTWIELNEAAYPPIEQGVVLIKRAKKINKQAQQFYTFLFSEEAQQILKRLGYTIVPPPASIE